MIILKNKKIYYQFYYSILFLIMLTTNSICYESKSLEINIDKKDSNSISIGKIDAPNTIIIYSSLTCPHCANFHLNVYPSIIKKYVLTKKVKIILKDFPLDLAALNAAKIVHCSDNNKKMQVLDEIYKKQKEWIVGESIENINKNLLTILKGFDFTEEKINKCLINEEIEESVINSRIDGQKKYAITSTPTIIINNKKYDGSLNFEKIEKILDK